MLVQNEFSYIGMAFVDKLFVNPSIEKVAEIQIVSLWPMIHNLFNKVTAIFNIFSWMNANLLSRFNHGCTQTYFQYFLADVPQKKKKKSR